MKKEFMAVIAAKAEKLSQSLIKEAEADFHELYSRRDLTPTEAKELANKYINMFLSQEVQFNATKALNPA